MAQTKVKLISNGVITVDNLHTNHGITTDHIGEGSVLYYTDARVANYLTTNNYITTTDVASLETTTSLSLSASTLSYIDESGTTTNIDLSSLGYLTSFTETDPIYVASSWYTTTNNAANWDTAYSWGNHATQSYATQTYVNTAVANLVDTAPTTLDTLNELAAALGDDPNFATTVSTSIGTKWTQDNTKISNWDTAYGWGNHASAGYLTSYSETDTLATVTARGNISSGSLVVGSGTADILYVGGSDKIRINFDQVWTNTGNLHFQYSSAGNIDMNFGGGYTFSRTSLRAPIFYDSNNTGYYLDPNSNSKAVTFHLGNGSTFNAGSTYALQLSHNNRHLLALNYNNSANYPWLVNDTWNGGAALIVHFNGVGDRFFVNSGGHMQADGSSRAPIFYDSNDTGYYLDLNTSGSTPSLKVAGNIELTARSASWAEGIRINVPTAGSWGGVRFTRGAGPGNWALGYTGINSTDDLTFWSGTTNTIQLNLDHSANLVCIGSMRSPIFYDSNDTSYYVNPNGQSELSDITLGTRARWGRSRYHTNRQGYTSDQGYWTGTNGWGTSEGTWDNVWKGGFSGWDVWGENSAHPQGASYKHAQGIVSGQHYTDSSGSSAYGWMMVGAHNATENRYWLRGKWSTNTSGWVEMYTTGNMDAPNRSGTSYYQANTWIQLNGYHGLYAPSWNNAHFYPNNATYGSWRIAGSRNGWHGIHFDSNMTLMMNNTECGFHREGDGWYIYSSSKNLYSPGDVTAYWSDKRLKKNIKPINNGLEKTLALIPCEFEWNEKASTVNENLYDGKKEVSLIAQEVQEIIPDAVTENLSAKGDDEEKYLTIKYDKIVPYLIQAIKEQQKQIEELKQLINK